MRTYLRLLLCALALVTMYIYPILQATFIQSSEVPNHHPVLRTVHLHVNHTTQSRSSPLNGAHRLAFLVIGDWGKPLPETIQVAKQMGYHAELHNATFVVSTGDNFYMKGVSSVKDPLFKTNFEDVFVHPALHRTKWYISLGNHDQTQGTAAQVEYTNVSDRWYLPHPYYTVSLGHDSDSPPLLDLFVLDHYHQIGKQYSLFTVQLPWLASQLRQSKATWKVLVDHRPVFSGGSLHGSSSRLQKELIPILKEHHVQLVLNGDDHGLQVLQHDGITYVVSGGGSWLHGHAPIAQTQFGASVNGFTLHRVDRTHMDIDVIDVNGTTLFSKSICA